MQTVIIFFFLYTIFDFQPSSLATLPFTSVFGQYLFTNLKLYSMLQKTVKQVISCHCICFSLSVCSFDRSGDEAHDSPLKKIRSKWTAQDAIIFKLRDLSIDKFLAVIFEEESKTKDVCLLLQTYNPNCVQSNGQ